MGGIHTVRDVAGVVAVKACVVLLPLEPVGNAMSFEVVTGAIDFC